MKASWMTVVAIFAIGCIGMVGCGGEDGAAGTPGTPGAAGTPGPAGPPGTAGPGAALFGNFPGSQVSAHLVGLDGTSFSGGIKVNRGLNVYWNCSDGTAIVLFIDETEHLYATFWDKTSFTPITELRGPNQRNPYDEDRPVRTSRETDVTFDTMGIMRVLFLNTASRMGDAVIAWNAQDQSPVPGLAPDTEANHRLYATYFDRSAVAAGVSGTVKHGFETAGIAVDYDNVYTAGQDDDVMAFGFVSDSLYGSHGFDVRPNANSSTTARTDVADDSIEFAPHDLHGGSGNALRPATRSGQPTTYASLVWIKGQSTGATAAGNRVNFLTLNLAGSANPLVSQSMADFTGGANLVPIPGAFTVNAATDVKEEFVVHNGCLLWAVEDSGALDRVVLTKFTNAAGMPAPPVSIELSDAATAEPMGPIGPEHVYGDDHGLSALYTFVPANLGGVDTVYAARVDLTAAPVSELVRIDDVANVGAIGPGISQISRSGAWLLGVWDEGGTVFAHAIRTQPAGPLATSVMAGGPLAMTNQVALISGPNHVFGQCEVATGRDGLSFCGVQSNVNRLNWAWHETTADKVELRYNGLIVDLGVTPPTGALAEGAAPAGHVASGDNNYDPWDTDNGMHPLVADLGTPGGEPIVYFSNNANNPTDNTAAGAHDEIRIFGWAGVAGALPADARIVSTDGTGTEQSFNSQVEKLDDFYEPGGQLLRCQTTPPSLNGASPHSGQYLHVFWLSARNANDSDDDGDSMTALRTRRLDKAAFLATPSITTAHVPALTVPPISLDGDNFEAHWQPAVHPDDDEIGPFTTFCTVDATGRVGLYFQSEWKFWYQEFNAGAWLTKPEMIDNWTDGGLFPGRDQRAYAFAPHLMGTCNTFNGVLLFMSKPGAGEDYGARNWYARSHD